jgi:prophage antirepressor-like protein
MALDRFWEQKQGILTKSSESLVEAPDAPTSQETAANSTEASSTQASPTDPDAEPPDAQFTFNRDSMCLEIEDAQMQTSVKMWWVADDVWLQGKGSAIALGHKAPNDAVAYHVRPDNRRTFRDLCLLLPGLAAISGEHPQAIYINEIGLNSLALGSRLRRAQAFKQWIVTEVLPSFVRRRTCPQAEHSVITSRPVPETLQLNFTSFLDETKRHLYLMTTATENTKGHVKIGVAKDVLARMSQFQTAHNDVVWLLVVCPHAEKLEGSVLRRLPLAGSGGTEWRIATREQFKQAVQDSYDELKAVADLPSTMVVSAKRKREEPPEMDVRALDLKEREIELQITADNHQLAMENGRIDLRQRNSELQWTIDQRQFEKDRHQVEMQRQALEFRQQAIALRKQELDLAERAKSLGVTLDHCSV